MPPYLPLKGETHFAGESVEKQYGLSPGCVDLIPLHRDAGEAAQAEVVDGAKLPAVPVPEGAAVRGPEGSPHRGFPLTASQNI